MRMTRRQFLQVLGAATAAPVLVKLNAVSSALGDAKWAGVGWRAWDMGDYILLRIAPSVVVADQHFPKPVIAEMGDQAKLARSQLDGPINVQEYGSETASVHLSELLVIGRPDMPAITMGPGVCAGGSSIVNSHFDCRGGDGLMTCGPRYGI